MRNLPSIVANYDSASTGFGDGKLRDNPGDDTGSGVMSAWGNDIWYALRAIVTTWHEVGDVSDTAESENNHDVLDVKKQKGWPENVVWPDYEFNLNLSFYETLKKHKDIIEDIIKIYKKYPSTTRNNAVKFMKNMFKNFDPTYEFLNKILLED